MLPGRVSSPGPLTYESGALPIALCSPAAWEEQYQTHVTERKRNARRGRGIMPKTFEAKLRLL